MKQEFLDKIDLSEEQFIVKAVKDISNWYSYWEYNWRNAQRGITYLLTPGGQWDVDVTKEFKREEKALIEINKLKPQADNLFGQYANYVPEQRVMPINSDKLNQKEIDLVDSLLDSHLNNPHNNQQKKGLLFNQIFRGYAGWHLTLDYENEESYHKKITLHNSENPDLMFYDWRSIKSQFSDGSRGNYSGHYVRLSKEHFESLYPHVEYPVSFEGMWQTNIAQIGNWGSQEDIVLVKFNQRIITTKNLCELSTGQTIWEDEAEEVIKKNRKKRRQINQQNKIISLTNPVGTQLLQPPELIKIVNKTERKTSEIYIITMIRNEILEVEKWYSSYLPTGLVLGKAYIDSNENFSRVTTTWFGQYAKGAQDLNNYGVTLNANAMKNACFEKIWMGARTVGEDGRYYKAMNNAKNVNKVLIYDDTPGMVAPQKVNADTISPIFLQTSEQASQDIQQITGIHPAAMGADEKVRSGYAIGLNISRSLTTNMDILTNNFDTIQQIGNVILSIFPVIYDSTQKVTIPSQDGSIKEIEINSPKMDMEGNQKVENDLRRVKYQVKIEVGLPKDYQTQLENEQIMKFAQAYPQAAAMTVDLAAYSLGIKKSSQLGKRCESLVPQNIIAEETGQPPKPQSPSPEMQLHQKQLQVEQQKLGVDSQKNQVEMLKAKAELKGTRAKAAAETDKAQHQTLQAALKTEESVNDMSKRQLEQENEQLKQAIGALTQVMR